MGAVCGLRFYGRVPPAVEVDDVCGFRQVEAEAAGSQREDEGRGAWRVEVRDFLFALGWGQRAVHEGEGAVGEFLLEGIFDEFPDFCVLREYESGFAGGENGLYEIEESEELAFAVAHEFEARDESEDVAAHLLARAIVLQGGLVICAFSPGQLAIFADFALFAEFRGDFRVAFEAAQDEGLQCMAEAFGGAVLVVEGERLGEAFGESLAVGQEAGVEEIFEAPDIGDGVFDRRAC